MNKLLGLTLASLIASYAYLPSLVQAEEAPPTIAPDSATAPATTGDDSAVPPPTSDKEKKPEVILGFSLQNRVNDGSPQPAQDIEPDPQKLMDAIKSAFQAQLTQYSKPMQINTELKAVLSEKAKEMLENLPTLSIRTNISKTGDGKSTFKIPSWQKEVTERSDHNAGVIDWKGLSGNLEFTETFDHVMGDLNVAGLSIAAEKEFGFSFENLTLSVELDQDLMPTKMKFNLPSIKGSDEKSILSMQGLAFDVTAVDSGNGVQLGIGEFQIPEFSMKKEGAELLLKNLNIKTNGEGKGELVHFNIHSEIGQLFIPKEITETETWDVSYAGDIVVGNLDAASVSDLQQTVRRLRRDGTLSEEMIAMALFGKLMEVAPKLLAKSPEIGITGLNISLPKGKLQGGINFRIDGTKPVSFQDPMSLLAALEAKADFIMGKGVLETVLAAEAREMALAGAGDSKLSDVELAAKIQESTDQQIQAFVMQKFLVDAGNGNYTISANFKAQTLTLNDQLMPLPFLPPPDSSGQPPANPTIEPPKQ